MSRRKASDLTVTDQFCGAGGSSIGATAAGARLRMALNHWDLAVETHNTNFPDADHDCTDISATDPRRYPATDVLITSPECTTHSPAGGSRRSKPQRDLFIPASDDPATARSRATMWDVPRFAEFHQYNIIIVENVVEAYTRWPLFHTWLTAMDVLGYAHKIVCLNSMFCHPTPQSRDRLYIVFWKKKNRAPKLDFMPPAYCSRCERDVPARQTWKNGRTVGKYKTQYIYTCPDCRFEVKPYYFAALNALDFSVAAQRIGDRTTPLKPRTMERIRFGLEKYGRQSLLVTTNQTNRLGGRVRRVVDPNFTQSGSGTVGVVHPFVVDTAYSHSDSRRAYSTDEALPTQSARLSAALVGSPFLVSHFGNSNGSSVVAPAPSVMTRDHHAVVVPPAFFTTAGSRDSQAGAIEPMPTQTDTKRIAAVIPPAAIVKLRGGEKSHLKNAKGIDSAIDTLSSGGNHYLLVAGAALLSMRDVNAMHVAGLDAQLMTQGTAPQSAVISPAPFLTSYYGTAKASGVDEAADTMTVRDRHALVSPGEEINIDDCYFRMLQPHEIGAAMAFPSDYVVLGSKRDKVKQFGNAVTPPAMSWLFRQAAASLHPELAR